MPKRLRMPSCMACMYLCTSSPCSSLSTCCAAVENWCWSGSCSRARHTARKSCQSAAYCSSSSSQWLYASWRCR
jgi:hypothetical protein